MEAVIVRVMKSRKTLEHNQLVMETTRHLASRFSPTPLLIKVWECFTGKNRSDDRPKEGGGGVL